MTKEELLRKYEVDRELLIAKHREEFLLLEKKLTKVLDELRNNFLESLDKVDEPVQVVFKGDLPKKEEEVKEVKKEEPKVSVKKGSKSAWNMQCRG